MLGVSWIPSSDVFVFNVALKLKSGVTNVTVHSMQELKDLLYIVTRRTMLSNVAKIFDPLGLLSPLLLEGKLLLRESWCVPGIGWDDPLPEDQAQRWVKFLNSLLRLKEIRFPRSLWPEEEVVGLPILVIFSDGSALAYGTVAYIRWELRGGGFWARIIMSKCKIAPKHILSIPRMELLAIVLGNRIKNFILKETNIVFAKTYQLVDSSTVLGYVHKQCGVFNPFEGQRVAEVQASNVVENGMLKGFAWVKGEDNPADWNTKPRSPSDLVSDGFWQNGPSFLLLDESMWPIKFTYKTGRLEGELKIREHKVFFQVSLPDILGRLLHRYSRWSRIVRVLCWMLRIVSGGVRQDDPLSAVELQNSKQVLIKYAQKDMQAELSSAEKDGVGRYKKLAPVQDSDGLWRVGSRMKNYVPFTHDSKMPVIIPPKHRVTRLVMEDSHRFSHSGMDGTVSRFRLQGFWTVGAGRIAKSVKESCVPCRKTSGKPLYQPCGEIPAEQLQQPMAWGFCQLDLLGPVECRGDVNPRARKKFWGLIIEDVNSGAVHLDIVSDYSTNAVLKAQRRFGSTRGWPGVIHSDPGSQLESASGKLECWWKKMKKSLATFAGSKNFRWETSPADSPWRQGKVERRIGIVKKHLQHAIGDSVLTPLELQTILFEIANICNERPITVAKPRDDGSYSVVTPNQLLMGRSCNILPDDGDISENLPVTSRYRLISHVTSDFWQRWSAEASPGLIVRQKWHSKSRNLCPGDVVMIAEPTKMKAKYKLAVVEDVKVSRDGFVRSARLRYNNITVLVLRTIDALHQCVFFEVYNV